MKKKKPAWEGYVRAEAETMLRSACGIPKGQNYKAYVPLSDLITYKIDKGQAFYRGNKEEAKFKAYIAVTDEFAKLIAEKWPFLDVSNITLEWTAEQVLEKIVRLYESVPSVVCDGKAPQFRDNTADLEKIESIILKHIGPHVNPRKKIKREKSLRHVICNAKWDRDFNYNNEDEQAVIRDIVEAAKEELKEELGESFYMNEWSSINDIKKYYSSENKF